MNLTICDDQPEFIEEFKARLENYFSARGLACFIFTYTDGRHLLDADTVSDIIFLDIKMGDLSGLKTAQMIREKDLRVKIVFLTAYKQYVFQAFDVDASHYLVKPVSEEKLTNVLDHLVAQIQEAVRQFVSFKTGNSVLRLSQDDIIYLEVIDRKVFAHTRGGVEAFYGRLDSLEKQLPSIFYRCHRSYIVNMSAVTRLGKADLLLCNGETVPISKRKYADFARAFMQLIREEEV